VDRPCDFEQPFQQRRWRAPDELAEFLDLAPSTVHTHLQTLYENEYVIKEGDEYHLGMSFIHFGEYVRHRKDLYVKAKEKAEQLAEETKGRTHFVVEQHGVGVYVYTYSGENAVKAFSEPGLKTPLHLAAAGKSILAHLPDTRVEEIIEQSGLEPETDSSITSAEELHAELETIRERGYACNREEHLRGVKAVGAPILEDNGTVLGAFSVSGPVHRMKGKWFESELPDILLGVTNELELELAYS
jgi:DNA-binding IclR family transcriptional regulator